MARTKLILLMLIVWINTGAQSISNAPVYVEAYLSQENCTISSFNLCYDGYEQPFRFAPLLVKSQVHDFAHLYDTIYRYAPNSILKGFSVENKDYIFPWDYDSIIATKVNLGIDSFCFENYRVNVFDFYTGMKHPPRFNGCFYYDRLGKVKLKVIFGGETEINLPNIDMKKGDSLLKSVKSNVFWILSIE